MEEVGSKWMVEIQSDGDMEAFRILETSGNKATLKYIAMDADAADNLVTALNWMDTFRTGIVPAVPVAKRRPGRPKRKPETLVVQFELEDQPKKPRPRRK